MRDVGNVLQVASLRPDYMGFIFYPKSPRYVGADFKIPDSFPGHIRRVGVFVNESVKNILMYVERLSLDYVQLHGNETVEDCEALKKKGVGVIKVFSIDDQFDFGITSPYKHAVDYFLFDTKGKYYGGNAAKFNWGVLKQYDQSVPFFLSGGISPDDVAAVGVLKGLNLFALDVNSGVEESPGLKDVSRVKALTENLKELNIEGLKK